MADLTVVNATRAAGTQPRKRQRRNKRTSGEREDDEAAQEEAERDRVLQEEVKWAFFLFGEMREECYDPVIKSIWGQDCGANSVEYVAAKQIFSQQTRNHKRTTLNNCIAYVYEVRAEDRNLQRMREFDDTVDYFRDKFSSENFFNLWTPMKKLFAFDESTALAKYFCTELYANLLAFANRYVIANEAYRTQLGALCDADGRDKSYDKNAKTVLDNDFVVVLGHDDFKHVSITQFRRLTITTKGARERKQRDLSSLKKMKTSGAPPPPSTYVQPSFMNSHWDFGFNHNTNHQGLSFSQDASFSQASTFA